MSGFNRRGRAKVTTRNVAKLARGLHWTCTSGGLFIQDPEISPNQWWGVGLLTNQEFVTNDFSTNRATLMRIRGEILLYPTMEEDDAPGPTPGQLTPGYEYVNAYIVVVYKFPENPSLEAGDWLTTQHDGVTCDPLDAVFYTGGVDVLWRGLYTQRMKLTGAEEVGETDVYHWSPQNAEPLQVDVKVHRVLDEENSLYLGVYPVPATPGFTRSFSGIMNFRTLFKS